MMRYSLLLLSMLTVVVSAQQARQAGPVASDLPPILREVGFDQNLDKQIPLDITFKDENGEAVQIGRYFGAKPSHSFSPVPATTRVSSSNDVLRSSARKPASFCQSLMTGTRL